MNLAEHSFSHSPNSYLLNSCRVSGTVLGAVGSHWSVVTRGVLRRLCYQDPSALLCEEWPRGWQDRMMENKKTFLAVVFFFFFRTFLSLLLFIFISFVCVGSSSLHAGSL